MENTVSFSTCVSVIVICYFANVTDCQTQTQETECSEGVEDERIAKDSTYVGCFQVSCLGPEYSFSSLNMTIDLCLSSCNARAKAVAGLLEGQHCSCGNFLCRGQHRLCERSCGVPCSGDDVTLCGGLDAIQIYNISDVNHTIEESPSPSSDTPTCWKASHVYRLLTVVIIVSCILHCATCFSVVLCKRFKKRRADIAEDGAIQQMKTFSKEAESDPDKGIRYSLLHRGPHDETGEAVTKVTTVADAELDYHSYESCSNERESVHIEQESARGLSGGYGYHGYIEVDGADTTSSTPQTDSDKGHRYCTSIIRHPNFSRSQDIDVEGECGHKYYTSVMKHESNDY